MIEVCSNYKIICCSQAQCLLYDIIYYYVKICPGKSLSIEHSRNMDQHIRTHTHTHTFNGPFSGTTWVSRYQKGKPIWILLKQETVSSSGISWAICKSAPCFRQITTLVRYPTTLFFTGRMPFLPPNSVKALKA